MTTKQADKLIATGTPTLIKDIYGDTGTLIFVSRDKRTIYTACGAALPRSDLTIVKV